MLLKTIALLRESWFGPLLIGFVLIVLVVPTAPYEAIAGKDDDELGGGALAALLLLGSGAVAGFGAQHTGAQMVFDQLQAAVEGARLAESEGIHPKEIGQLGKAIGAAEALMGMTSSCGGACDDVRSTFQNIIGILARVKSKLLGISRSCQPNGVIQPNEQCDPLAAPTGCPTSATAFLFCTDECQCQGIVP
jgi:hypothetical protein